MLDELFELFRRCGFEGVSLHDISVATGRGKSSLYHHFPGGKAEMAAAVLDRAIGWFRAEVVGPLREEGPRQRRVDRMLAALDDLYCAGAKPCILASMLLGGAQGAIGTSVGGAFRLWRDALTDALAETGCPRAEAIRRSTAAIAQVQGALILSRALDDRSLFKQSLEDARELLLC